MHNTSNQQHPNWLNWAVELQSLAQAGLFYSQGVFDQERYQRIREIAAEMVAKQAGLPLREIKALFCDEIGYQTPKQDARAAIVEQGKILLVQESDGRWALPGGWVDIGLSLRENVEKEVLEEAGLTVKADFIIAIHDQNKRNVPPFIHKVFKTFIACHKLSGEFSANSETIASGYFSLNEIEQLPLATEKNSFAQIALCLEAITASQPWQTQFD